MGRSRTLLAAVAVVAVALGGVPASVAEEEPLAAACADAPQGRFADVSGVHEAGIDCIGWWGVTQGTGDGSYLPGDPVNRAQMATFVARAIELSGGQLPVGPPAAFDDTAGNVHAANIDALAALGVVGGVGDGLYAPDREVTRAQMATFLSGAWQARAGVELAAGQAQFDDIEGNVHAEAIAAITAVGWTGGTAPGIYEPGLAVTRAQMGTFLARWLTTLVEDGHATYPPANPIPIPEPDEPEAPEGPGAGDDLQWQRVPGDETVFESWSQMHAVTAGGPGLVAMGQVGGRTFPDGLAIWTSTDGTDWQQVDDDLVDGGGGFFALDVVAGGPGLVAVGLSNDVGAAVWTSVDGLSWERIAHDDAVFGGYFGLLSDEYPRMNAVTVGGPGLVAVGQHAEGAVWTSVDGLSWERVDHGDSLGERARMSSVTQGGPGLVAVGRAGDFEAAIWTSADGTEWQRADLDGAAFEGAVPQSVTAGGPGLVAVGYVVDEDDPDRPFVAAVLTSADGLSWERVEHDDEVFGLLEGFNRAMMESVTAGGPGLVAVGSDNDVGTVWTSTDGTDWQRATHGEPMFGDTALRSVTVGGPGLVAVGDDRGEFPSAAVWISP